MWNINAKTQLTQKGKLRTAATDDLLVLLGGSSNRNSSMARFNVADFPHSSAPYSGASRSC
jgi:hypothetical protein